MSADQHKDKVSQAIFNFNQEWGHCKKTFARLREDAKDNQEAIDNANALEKVFDETMGAVVTQIQEAYANQELTEQDAYVLLGKAKDVAHAVANQHPIDNKILRKIGNETRPENQREEIGGMRYKSESNNAKTKAILGLLTTGAIVATVAIALTLAVPSMGTSLLLLLPLALTGAGCAIPSALNLRKIELEKKQDLASGEKAGGYAKQLQEAYKNLLPKGETPKSDRDANPDPEPDIKP